MKKIIFVCHGNICRSPMAEFIMKDLVCKKNLQNKYIIQSRATSSEAIGCDIHSETKKILIEKGIEFSSRKATQLKLSDYDDSYFIIAMDNKNIENIERIFGQSKMDKVFRLLDFTDCHRDILDPWYTANFQKTYNDIFLGCVSLLNFLEKI